MQDADELATASPSDALGALAPLFRVRPELQTLCRFGEQWASPHEREAAGWAPFHMVTAGSCLLDLSGEAPARLDAGDIAILPHGDPHLVRGLSSQGTRFAPPLRTERTEAITIKSNVDAPDAELICGRLTFEQAHGNFARAALPRLIRIGTRGPEADPRLGPLVLTIREELLEGGPGSRAICSDLASALFLMVVRAHFAKAAPTAGLLRLLGRRQTARAVKAMLDDPARAWTLDQFAAEASTSRASLVREFRRLAEASPFEVLALLRLGLARHHLANSSLPLAEIAATVGYASQSAFSRAFQRAFGLPPGEVRQSANGREISSHPTRIDSSTSSAKGTDI